MNCNFAEIYVKLCHPFHNMYIKRVIIDATSPINKEALRYASWIGASWSLKELQHPRFRSIASAGIVLSTVNMDALTIGGKYSINIDSPYFQMR